MRFGFSSYLTALVRHSSTIVAIIVLSVDLNSVLPTTGTCTCIFTVFRFI